MNIGVCYFPEHWPRERWAEQVEAMAEAGIEYVRMGEFAWSRYEPRPGEFDFGWLEEAVDLVAKHGMEAVLCTPTAAPPKWLVDEHPDMLQETAEGVTKGFGGRRHYCYNSEPFREATERIVSAMAERFADHPAVAGWQTDNEYGNVRCYCDDCAAAFREWLREKFDSIEELNESWGNAFWSQTYDSFAAVDPPRRAAAQHHPARLLDFYRFSSASAVAYNRLQTDLLRDADEEWFVTHNFMHCHGEFDVHAMCEDLDFASWDSYPTGHVQLHREEASERELRVGDPDLLAMNHALYRGAAAGDFWIMEQQPGGVNWPPHPTQPAEGAMRLWAHHAAAHGAESVTYFRWQRCRMGQEQYHAGLRHQDGSADRGYHDAAAAAAELDSLDAGEREPASVAVLHDYENGWGLDIEPASVDFDYWHHLETYYAALRRHGVPADVVATDADLSTYDAIVAPTLYFADEDLAARLESFVDGGGELLCTVRSGVKDEHNKLRESQPGPLSELVGAAVDQYEGFRGDETPEVTYAGETHTYRTWGEWLAPEAGAVRGTHETGVADGEPAVVRNERGAGAATYVGVWPGEALADALVADLLDAAGVERTDTLPEGVRPVRRGGLTWVVNFSTESQSVDAGGAAWLVGDGEIPAGDCGVVDARPAELSFE